MTVTLQHERAATGETSTIRARYVVGCDGARSAHPDRDRPRAGRRRDERVVGRDGRPGGHRLPGHPAQVRDPLRRRATSSSSRARADTSSGSTSSWTSSRSERSTTGASLRRSSSRPRTGSCTRTRSRSKTSRGGRCTRSASVCATSSTTCREETATASAGLHRRRRLPHAQRQGRPGHERVDGRHLEPRVEAGGRAARDGPAGAPAHLLRRSGRRSPRS